MKLRIGASTDVGRVRAGNEDSYVVDEPLFAVADGMGGHQGGEVASKLALETLGNPMPTRRNLAETVREANRAVFQKAAGEPQLTGMGTTLTAVLLEGERFALAHIGDSRLYLLRDGELRRVTRDHTVVERLVEEGRLTPEDAAIHPQRSILTRALGVDEEVEVDEDTLELRVGDRVLLCSDGLTGMIEDDDVRRLLAQHDDPQRAADTLVEAANEAGGQDNITTIVIHVLDDDAPAAASETTAPAASRVPAEGTPPAREESRAFAARSSRGWPVRVALWIVLPLLVVGAGLWGAKTLWVDKQFFVGAAEDHVALYRGIPAQPLGLDLSTLEEEFPTLTVADVETFPAYSDLASGITAESEDDARAIIEQMLADVAARQQQEERGGT